MRNENLTREQIKRIVEEVVDQVVGTEEQYQAQKQDSSNCLITWTIDEFDGFNSRNKAIVEVSTGGYKLSCTGDEYMLLTILMNGITKILKIINKDSNVKGFYNEMSSIVGKYLNYKKQEA